MPRRRRRGRVGVLRGRRRAELPVPARGLDDRAGGAGLLLDLQAPESATMARDVATVADEYDGRFLAGLVDIDTTPAIAQAMQIPQVPMLFVLLDGRPATQPIPGLIKLDELRTLFNQLGQQLTAQGITGRHQPRSTRPGRRWRSTRPSEPPVDPRYAAAQDALGEGDIDLAVAEYQKLVDGNPADIEAAAGLAMAKVLQRTAGRRPERRPRGRRRQPRRRGRPDPGGRPGHARRPRRRRVQPAGRRRPPHLRRRPQQGPRAPARACSPPSATTTPACARPGRTSPPRSSERRAGRR